MAINLTPEQHEAVFNRGGSLLVSAAAGSGKTRVLVERLMERVVKEGADMDQFLIITYTKAAAAELRGKILDALNERMADDPNDRNLRRQASLIHQTQISTIHSFCQTVLRDSGHLIDLDADFRVAEESECGVLKKRVLDSVMESHYEKVESGDDFSRLLDRLSAGRDDRKLLEMVLDIHAKVQSHPDPAQWLRAQREQFRLENVSDAGETPWGRLLMEDSLEQAEYWRQQMSGLLDELEGDAKLQGAYSEALWDLMDSLDDFIAGLRIGWDEASRASTLNYGRLKPVRDPDDPMLKERVKSLRDGCKKRMEKVTERFARTSGELLSDLRAAAPAVISLLALTEEFDAAYAKEKRRRRLVDFGDLEHLALKVLVDGNGGPTDTARRLSGRYVEVMVDEYQDTNQVQNAIFDAVSDGGKKLFLVGDVKQSIYRFRLADPTIFLRKFQTFLPFDKAGEGESRKVVLTRNFRSRASVLEGTNFLFKGLMTRAFGEIDYTPEHYLVPGLPFPEHPNDNVELDVVDLANLEQSAEEEKDSRSRVEADFIARRLKALVMGGFQVTEGEGLRPANWEDVVILHRSPGTVMGELTNALDSQRIPWQAEGGEDFFSTTEISTALGYLQIIDNPHQDVPLISVLRSPLYGFSADDLAAIRAGSPDTDFYTAVVCHAEKGDPACRDFLTEFQALRERSVDQTAPGLLWELYEETGMLSLFYAMPGGEMRRSNLLLLYESARRYEGAGHKGVFGFVTQLRRMMEAGQTMTVGGGFQGSGVKIMSIHKSKGLEFPIVVVAGLSRRFNRADETRPMLFHADLGVGPKGLDLESRVEFPTLARTAVALRLERELCAEELRLLYVAMTRAREKLILTCAFQDAKKTLARLAQEGDWPMEPQALMGMSCMAEWILSTVMCRTEGAVLRCGVEPRGRYLGADKPWDIRLVDGQHPEKYLRKKREGLKKGEDFSFGAEEAALLTWKYPKAGVEDIPSKLTATQLKGRFLDEEAAEDTRRPQRPMDFLRPDFARKEKGLTPQEAGTALHLFLQLCDPDRAATAKGAAEELKRLVEMGCLTPQQGKACDTGKAAKFFSSPLGKLAREAGMEREFKFSILTDGEAWYGPAAAGEQVLLQGVVDLWFQTLEGITVVDFKTDHIRPDGEGQRAEHYRGQIEVYAGALTQITGTPVVKKYLWFFQTDTSVEL